MFIHGAVMAVAAVLTSATLFTTAPGTDAQVAPAPSAALVAEANYSAAQWELAQPAVTRSGGRVVLDGAKALALGVNAAQLQGFADGVVAGGGSVTGVTPDPGIVAELKSVAPAANPSSSVAATALKLRGNIVAEEDSCQGEDNVTTQWFGEQIKLDSCATNNLIGLLSSGAGTAAIAALITSETGVGGVTGGIIAGVLAIGSGVLQSCAADGTGTIIDIAWNGVPWCAAQ